MTQQSRQQDDQAPNHASSMEKAEGSRENVQGSGASGTGDGQEGAGITNRPIAQEHEEQDSLPPRGTAKDGSHA
jgi:hypothetical protein